MALLVAGCGGSKQAPKTTPVKTPTPQLTRAKPCKDIAGATCSTLTVPLDRSGKTAGTLDLRVASAGDRNKPVFVVLSGGPGEPSTPLINRARQWLGPATAKVRLVALDTRGTGRHALDCPALQKAMGASDLTPPTRDQVTGCADKIGDKRRFYTTRDTVEDLDALRQALNTDTIALDGTSYGTFVAQRYALAHPQHVSGLVLDSVVPSEGASLLSEVSIKATRRVLGAKTTKELAQVIASEHNGPQVLDMLTGLSVGAPRSHAAQNAIHQAAQGNPKPLDGLIHNVQRVMERWGAKQLSQGLHASTLCADTPAPWGSAAAPMDGRKAALDAAAAKLSDADLYPYDRATATGNGIALQCLYWPPEPVRDPPPAGRLPDVPVVLLGGTLDLSTPLEWTRQAATRAPHGKLIVVENDGHGVQSQKDPKALGAVRALVASLR